VRVAEFVGNALAGAAELPLAPTDLDFTLTLAALGDAPSCDHHTFDAPALAGALLQRMGDLVAESYGTSGDQVIASPRAADARRAARSSRRA